MSSITNKSCLNEATVQPHFTTAIETSIKDKHQQHHERSLPKKGQMARVELSPEANVQWKVYKMSNDIDVPILTGTTTKTGCFGVTTNLMRNKKQLLSYCVAALSYARIYTERSWKPKDIDKIIDIGWNINRRALMKRPMNFEHQAKVRDATDVFYIDSVKFVTMTKASTTTGIIKMEDLSSVYNFFENLQENRDQPCIVEYGSKFFSFWNIGDKYFIFHPMGLYHKTAKCVQLSSFDFVQKYLIEIFGDSQFEYILHSVDFLKVNNREILRNYEDETGLPKFVAFPDDIALTSNEFPHNVCLLPNEQQPPAYECLSELKDVLRCSQSIDRTAKIPSACVVAIVVLRVKKPYLWTSETLEEILALGSKTYKQNLKLKPKGHTEIRVSDITQKMEYGKFQCLIESQQIFFGKVESTVANVCNVEQGLSKFFKTHVAGVIDGPNIVGIWKEGNYYYMYDAKARDRYGRKLSKGSNEDEEKGMSCVTRFQQLKDLVEIYIANISSKDRNEYYKITQIELKPFLGKNWFDWKVSVPGQWHLRGVENFNSKTIFSVSVMSLLYAESVNMKKWKASTIDEIASGGSQDCNTFDVNYNMNEIKKEVECMNKTSHVCIKQNMFRYVVNEVDKNIEDDLVKGFSLFFEANKQGIFSFNTSKTWKYYSVWKSSNNWFAFGLHVISDESTGNERQEVLCALRFTSHINLVKSLTADIIIRKNQEYSLSLVTISKDGEQNTKKRMKNYKQLEVGNGCAGILSIGKSINLIGNYADEKARLKNTYYTISVLAMTLIKDCWTWTNYDVWDILKIAQKSLRDPLKELRKFTIRIGSTTIKIKELQTFLGELDGDAGEEHEKDSEIIKREIKDEIQNEIKKEIKKERNNDTKYETKTDIKKENDIKSEIKNEFKSDVKVKTEIKSEDSDGHIDERSIIEEFLKILHPHDHPYGILKSKHLLLALWIMDGSFFIFNLRNCDENGIIDFSDSKTCSPYVAWFDSMDGIIEHILANAAVVENGSYEFVSLKFKTKVEKNSDHKSWYNFTMVDDESDQWIIRSMNGSLQNHYGFAGCIISLVFSSVLQPSDWNSSMIDSALKYGTKLYKKSLRTDSTKSVLKINEIVSPFIIGCYEFSFTRALFKCGANENNDLENSISNLFSITDFGIISSKGYSAAIWQQNNSYFMFDPHVNGMACLSRFSNTTLISKHFLSHISTGMTGVNIFEMYKVLISRNDIKRNDCPVDLEAIFKLTNRSDPVNATINENINMNSDRIFGTVPDKTRWIEFKDNPPTECLVVAACLIGSYKNPEYWTSHEMDEIVRLGKKIVLKTIKKCNLSFQPTQLRIQPHQIQGLYPFDEHSNVNIRMELFGRCDENKASDTGDSKLMLKDNLKATLTTFFATWDNAFISTTDATVTAWKQGIRFYSFYCQPVNDDGRLLNVGEIKGALLTFMSLDELYVFLENSFGENGLQDWFEIRYLDLALVPLQKEERKEDGNLSNTCCPNLNGAICQCSSDADEHVYKHIGLCLAAIVLSTICELKTWSSKLLGEIEELGKALHDEAVMASQNKEITIDDLPYKIFIEHVEYKIEISNDDTKYNLDETIITTMIMKEFQESSMLYISIETTGFSLIEQENIFYWYDPNGVNDANNEIRASVRCFSSMKRLAGHIVKLGSVLNASTFSVYFVKCQTI